MTSLESMEQWKDELQHRLHESRKKLVVAMMIARFEETRQGVPYDERISCDSCTLTGFDREELRNILGLYDYESLETILEDLSILQAVFYYKSSDSPEDSYIVIDINDMSIMYDFLGLAWE